MTTNLTYLELSEAGEGSHKFYEVKVDGVDVTIRYGRIGDQGRIQNTSYDTPEKAQKEAEKKIKSKLKKGYEPSVMGERKNVLLLVVKPLAPLLNPKKHLLYGSLNLVLLPLEFSSMRKLVGWEINREMSIN